MSHGLNTLLSGATSQSSAASALASPCQQQCWRHDMLTRALPSAVNLPMCRLGSSDCSTCKVIERGSSGQTGHNPQQHPPAVDPPTHTLCVGTRHSLNARAVWTYSAHRLSAGPPDAAQTFKWNATAHPRATGVPSKFTLQQPQDDVWHNGTITQILLSIMTAHRLLNRLQTTTLTTVAVL